MGDTRFRQALDLARDAQRNGEMAQVSPETCIQALGALAAESEPLLANVLASRALNQSRRAATLLRFVGEGVVALDVDGRVTYANPAAEELLGHPKDAMLGQDFHMLVHHHTQGDHEMGREACRVLSVLNEAGPPAHVDDHDVFTRADGSTFFVGFIAAAIEADGEPTGVALAFRDITRIKEEEAALRLQDVALEAVPAPIFFVQRDGSFCYANQAAADHLGAPSASSLVGERVFDVDVDMTPDAWAEHWQRIKRAGAASIASRHRRRDGRILPVTVRITHVEHDQGELHVAVVLPK